MLCVNHPFSKQWYRRIKRLPPSKWIYVLLLFQEHLSSGWNRNNNRGHKSSKAYVDRNSTRSVGNESYPFLNATSCMGHRACVSNGAKRREGNNPDSCSRAYIHWVYLCMFILRLLSNSLLVGEIHFSHPLIGGIETIWRQTQDNLWGSFRDAHHLWAWLRSRSPGHNEQARVVLSFFVLSLGFSPKGNTVSVHLSWLITNWASVCLCESSGLPSLGYTVRQNSTILASQDMSVEKNL